MLCNYNENTFSLIYILFFSYKPLISIKLSSPTRRLGKQVVQELTFLVEHPLRDERPRNEIKNRALSGRSSLIKSGLKKVEWKNMSRGE